MSQRLQKVFLQTTATQLQEAYDYALKNDVILVVAAGNQGYIGSTSLLNHPLIIPVVAYDRYSRVSAESNLGPSIGNQSLMAPGVDITSTTSAEGLYTQMSGTSVATPFVSGSIALLWSLFPDISAAQMLYSIRNSYEISRRHTIVPPLLNAEALWNNLKAMS
jgi:subtilisin family serine protease